MELHDYQRLARDYLREHPAAVLMLDMGLGKTAVALSALAPDDLPALVIAPKRVTESVWPAEAALWRPDLRVSLAVGAPAARAAALRAPADVYVISWDNMADVLANGPRARTLILDELSGYRGRGKRWRTALRIRRKYRPARVWGLTGTPVPNGYLDLWPQIYLLDEGARLGPTVTGYRHRYFYPGRSLPNGVVIDWRLRAEAEPAIQRALADIALAMETEGRVALPPVTYNRVTVDLPPAVRAVYTTLMEQLVVDLRETFGGAVHTVPNAAVLTNRLQQVTAGFLYPDPDDPNPAPPTVLHTAKAEAVREILESPHTGGVLVFYGYVEEQRMLAEALNAYAPRDIREPGVIDDWNAGRVPLLLAHPASAGHGLNLQRGGHTTVWTTLPWDLELWEQANRRLARQGQTAPVVIHTVLAADTIDGVVARRLLEKAAVQDALLDYLESPV